MSRIYIPAADVNDWRILLADPDKHWKDGYSAKMMAESWQLANGFPPSFVATFAQAGEPFHSLVPQIILPEHKVSLPGGVRPAQNDVWVLASHSSGLASITVEGKANEPFGPLLGVWRRDASGGKDQRLLFLEQLLGLQTTPPDEIRYQLLHRLGSAIVEAKRFHANVAMCVIQSFSETNNHFADFEAFCALFGKVVRPGEIAELGVHDEMPFYAVWIPDRG